MTEWFEEWFGEEYLQLYPHRDAAEAERAVALILRAGGLRAPAGGCSTSPAAPGGTRAPSRPPGARCVGLDLSAALLRVARGVTDAPLVRADMRALPDPPGLHGPHGQPLHQLRLFRARRGARRGAAARWSPPCGPGGWFVIDFLNAARRARAAGARARPGGSTAARCEVDALGFARRPLRLQDDPGTPTAGGSPSGSGCSAPRRSRRCWPAAGVTVRQRFGDYDASPLRPGLAAHDPDRAGGMTPALRPDAARAPARAARAARRAASTPALADGVRAVGHPGRGSSRGSGSPARWPSPPDSSRGSSPGRSTPSTRRSAPRRWRGVLERRWSRPVVPIFWLAGDDHDFAEASYGVLDRGRRRRSPPPSLPPRPPDAPLTPMYRQPLGEGVVPALEALAAGLPTSEFRDATLAWLERHYRPEATVGGELRRRAWPSCSARSACSCFDSTHPAAKRAAAPHLVRALQQARRARRRSRPLGRGAGRRRRGPRASPWATARRW